MSIINEEASRPWGYYEVLLDTPYTKVKEITVEPGQRLSYQSHKHREEYWTCVQGELSVILNDKELLIPYGHTIHIPLGAKHRMWNKGEVDLKVVEVQVGSYFGEDDIIRYEDDYARAELEHLKDGNYIGGLTMPEKNTNKLNRNE